MLHKIENRAFSAPEKVNLLRALQKAYNDLGDYDTAFSYAVKAGKVTRDQIGYKPEVELVYHNGTMKYFSKEFFDTQPASKNTSKKPVFILGMPRSGTTLLETILHAHKDIAGVGEDPFLREIIEKHAWLQKSEGIPFPFRNRPVERGVMGLDEIARTYLAHIEKLAPGAERIVNKAIANIQLAGTISLIFPNAYFIYIKRHPLASCVSSFMQHFAYNAQPYTNDLNDLGTAYAHHCELMEHWRTVLPKKIFELSYENLVEDTENQAKKVIEFLELPWDESCLSFYETEKIVRTASVMQVRQPIYKSSLDSWKKYEKNLGPLKEALGKYAEYND
jgi:hypothetical protein